MVLRDFRCVSARAAYRGVKNVDLRPSFCYGEKRGFYITSVSEKKPCVDVYALYNSFRQKIYKEEMTHG